MTSTRSAITECLLRLYFGQVSSAEVANPGGGGNRGSIRMDPRFLVMWPLNELKAEKAWLFPKLRLVEVYLAFFRVWLRRELQRGKYADLKLTTVEWDETVAAEEEHYLDFCRRLAFAMFKRGVTSWTVQHADPVPAAAGQAKVNLKQQMKAKQATAKASWCSGQADMH